MIRPDLAKPLPYDPTINTPIDCDKKDGKKYDKKPEDVIKAENLLPQSVIDKFNNKNHE